MSAVCLQQLDRKSGPRPAKTKTKRLFVCERDCAQSVRWPAATRAAVHQSSVARRLEPKRAKFCLRSEAAAVIGLHNHQDPALAVGRARPIPSLNHRTPNGRLSCPVLRYAVHFLSPGQAILPSVSG